MSTAVIPAAGLGTRFLPATKAIPKEMLPVLDRPGIQYAVEEAAAAGIVDIIIVTGPTRSPVEDHFAPAPELETLLAGRGDQERLESVREIARLPRITFARQDHPRGLGDAIRCTQRLVGGKSFAVLLPDELFPSRGELLARMMAVHRVRGGSLVALQPVEPQAVSRYGVVRAGTMDGDVCPVDDMVEKPEPHLAPSRLAVIGRYIISPSVFAILDRLPPGAGGEIQLTDALKGLIGREPLHGVIYRGARFDTGTLPGYLAAGIYLARRQPDLWSQVSALVDGGVE